MYLCNTMGKSLTQLTFDFAGTEVSENTSPVVPLIIPEEKIIAAVQEPIVPVSPDSNQLSSEGDIKKTKPTSTRGRRSLKDISINADLINIPPDEILFQKQYYSIGEVATMFRENQSLIRYWETEFDILQPRKNRKGDRFFRPVDIKNLVLIYDLLRRRKFTIEGAKDYLKKNKRAEEKFAMIQSLEKIKGFLLELKANL